jgi:hypothetical protein
MKLALTLVTLGLAASAQAQQANYEREQLYGLVSVGQGHLNGDCSGVQGCDRNATGGKAMLGYSLGNGLAIEGGYTYFGKFRASNSLVDVRVKPQTLSIGAAYTAALNQDWGLVGRVGVARVRTQVSADAGLLSSSDSQNSTQPIIGLAVNYTLSPTVKLELGVDATRAKYEGERTNLHMVSLGARMAF